MAHFYKKKRKKRTETNGATNLLFLAPVNILKSIIGSNLMVHVYYFTFMRR